MENAVRFLRGLATTSADAFQNDLERCYASAYALIMAIEGVAGIASHLVAACAFGSPQGMSDTFDELFRNGVITDAGLRERLGAMARFRNLLVHRYWSVDYARVHKILVENLDDFGLFAQQVEQFIDTRGGSTAR